VSKKKSKFYIGRGRDGPCGPPAVLVQRFLREPEIPESEAFFRSRRGRLITRRVVAIVIFDKSGAQEFEEM